MLTTNEALCLEYSNRTGQPRYLNARYRRFGSSDPVESFIETFKGQHCLAYAKDGQLFRSVSGGKWGPEFIEIKVEVEAN